MSLCGKVGAKLSNSQFKSISFNILCHIGLPKTGTSYLQKYFFPSHFNSFFSTYPPFKWPNEFGWIVDLNNFWLDHLKMDNSTWPRNQIECEFEKKSYVNLAAWKNSLASWKQAQHFETLISAEGLAGLSLPVAKTIAELLSIAGVSKVLFTYRKQTEWSFSLWSQIVIKEDRFARYIPYHNLFGISPSPTIPSVIDMNWLEQLKMYQEVFGAGNVLAIPYELMKESPEVFFKDVMSFFGINGNPPIEKVIENPSVSNNTYTGWKLDSMPLFVSFPKLRMRLHKHITPVVKKSNTLSKLLLKKEVSFQLSHNLKQEIMRNFEDSNKELAKLSGYDLAKYGYY